MRNTWIIAKKELYRFFNSPIAYIVYALFALITGYFFYIILIDFARNSASMSQGMEHTNIFRALWLNISVIFLFLLPAITMPVFSEEKKSGTLEILFTKPVKDIEIVLGKFLGTLLQMGIMLALSLILVYVFSIVAKPDWGWMISMYLGVILMTASFLSLGILASSLTSNQIIAAIFGFVFLLIFWLIQFFSDKLTVLSLMNHFESFSKGLIDAKDVVFFLSFIVVNLFITTRIIESRKWR